MGKEGVSEGEGEGEGEGRYRIRLGGHTAWAHAGRMIALPLVQPASTVFWYRSRDRAEPADGLQRDSVAGGWWTGGTGVSMCV